MTNKSVIAMLLATGVSAQYNYQNMYAQVTQSSNPYAPTPAQAYEPGRQYTTPTSCAKGQIFSSSLQACQVCPSGWSADITSTTCVKNQAQVQYTPPPIPAPVYRPPQPQYNPTPLAPAPVQYRYEYAPAPKQEIIYEYAPAQEPEIIYEYVQAPAPEPEIIYEYVQAPAPKPEIKYEYVQAPTPEPVIKYVQSPPKIEYVYIQAPPPVQTPSPPPPQAPQSCAWNQIKAPNTQNGACEDCAEGLESDITGRYCEYRQGSQPAYNSPYTPVYNPAPAYTPAPQCASNQVVNADGTCFTCKGTSYPSPDKSYCEVVDTVQPVYTQQVYTQPAAQSNTCGFNQIYMNASPDGYCQDCPLGESSNGNTCVSSSTSNTWQPQSTNWQPEPGYENFTRNQYNTASYENTYNTPSYETTYNTDTYTPTYDQQTYTPTYDQQTYTPTYDQQTYTPTYDQQTYTPTYDQQTYTDTNYDQQTYTPTYDQQTYTPTYDQPTYTPTYNQPVVGQYNQAPESWGNSCPQGYTQNTYNTGCTQTSTGKIWLFAKKMQKEDEATAEVEQP